MQWLKVNTDALPIVISLLALLISALTFYRTWRRDKLAEAKDAPRVTIRTENAFAKKLFIPKDRSQIAGWDFYVHLDIERFDLAFTILQISPRRERKATVRLHQPVGDGFRNSGDDPIDLIGDTSGLRFKPTKPREVFKAHFHLHIAKLFTLEEVEKGVPVDLIFDFELQDKIPKRELVDRQFVLRPGPGSISRDISALTP